MDRKRSTPSTSEGATTSPSSLPASPIRKVASPRAGDIDETGRPYLSVMSSSMLKLKMEEGSKVRASPTL